MAIEGVRRLGREYDRRLLRARNDAVENASCGAGVGAGLLSLPSSNKAAASSIMPVVDRVQSTGGCGSKSGGGCGSKKESSCSSSGMKTGGGCGSSTPAKELDTPSAELGGFNALNPASGGGFAQMHCRPPVPNLPTWTQQLFRSIIYGSQFSAAFIV